jgi:hypothetical protein
MGTDERRIDVSEARMRKLLGAGKTTEASKLRSEILKETDFAARQIWQTIPGSSAETPPWKKAVAAPYSPAKSRRWQPG